MKRMHEMPFGAQPTVDGGVRYRLWAPAAKAVELIRSGGHANPAPAAMQALPDGWFELTTAPAETAGDYAFRIDHDLVVPDPASRNNHHDVHGPSAFVDPRTFDWPEDGWRGRPWHEAVIYELHIGCFTPAGTFTAAIDRLDDLVRLGVTAIEIMPVADFPGERGWGYDGVLHFAPKAAYGSSDDFKRLVAQAHARQLMVLLDVVYNHFGPDGNYLHAYAPSFFNEKIHTPWGAAINFDGNDASRTVRSFYIHNALYWIEEFQLDGLRLDAVHAMHDTGMPHFVDELAAVVRAGPGRNRRVHLVLENDLNDALGVARDEQGRATHADAQWNDDVHHALHVIATGETDGYYVDYASAPVALLGRALAEGYAFQGEVSPYRGGELRGTGSTHLPPLTFVNSTQTHDQVGNRAFGERIAALAHDAGRDDAMRALTACLLLAPSVPMVFMGEEWAASTPFLYFCDFEGELAAAVTAGRRSEFGKFLRFNDPEVRERIPDPNAAGTFTASRLDWNERTSEPHAGWLAFYTALLHCRRDQLMPALAGVQSGRVELPAPGTMILHWPLGDGRQWHLKAQLASTDGPSSAAAELPGRTVWRSHPPAATLTAWSVQVAIEPA